MKEPGDGTSGTLLLAQEARGFRFVPRTSRASLRRAIAFCLSIRIGDRRQKTTKSCDQKGKTIRQIQDHVYADLNGTYHFSSSYRRV